ALVRIVLTKTTDVRSDLSDDLLVNTGDGQLGGAIGSEGNSLRSLHEDRVRVTQSELQVLTLLRYTVADAKDFILMVKPSVTPTTALLMSERDRPCSARFSRWSSGRTTRISLSSTSAVIG